MKSLIQWAVNNSPAMNTLMVTILIVGAVSMMSMRREVFPEFELEVILVTIPYPGATPEEVETGICQKIEEAIRSIEGVKTQTSFANEGFGFVLMEMNPGTDIDKSLAEIRSQIDQIPSLPELSERPEVRQFVFRQTAIRVGIVGPTKTDIQSRLKLREMAEVIRREILKLPEISQAKIIDSPEYQIDIEISEKTLHKYGLTLNTVKEIVRQQNIEVPAGSMKTNSQEVLLRGKNKSRIGSEIGEIPIISDSNGVALTINDLGKVRDEFTDTPAMTLINGRPGLSISVDRTSSEDVIRITNEVKEYVSKKNSQLPPGYEIVSWRDRSTEVRDRMELLSRNGIQGLILVFLVLAVFLEIRLAFWVALGIPISILGSCVVLLMTGQTLNMLSLFSFLMALGIVVDDAIVIGENIYAHRQTEKSYIKAAIRGTVEVLPAVTSSVATTIIAFMPLLYVSGVMGKFIAILPFAVISMLIISLVESMIILPCHLAHSSKSLDKAESFFSRVHNQVKSWPQPVYWSVGILLCSFAKIFSIFIYPFHLLRLLFNRINIVADKFLTYVIERLYSPSLRIAIKYPVSIVSFAVALLILAAGVYRAGITPWNIFPEMDSNISEAIVIYPNGTPSSLPEKSSIKIENAIRSIDKEYKDKHGKPLVKLIRRTVGFASATGDFGDEGSASGSHVCGVFIELVPSGEREVKSKDVVNEWRKRSGKFPGTHYLKFRTPSMGPDGPSIQFKMLADRDDWDELLQSVEEVKSHLGEYPGVYDITDDSSPGKWEYQFKIKEKARSLGIPLERLASTLRSAYYGAEVMRLQRGRHEVKLMVRYPREERRSLSQLDDLRIMADDGKEYRLAELAEINVKRGAGSIDRINQLRSITISADLDEKKANSGEITADLVKSYLPELFKKHPHISVHWEGEKKDTEESVQSMQRGFLVAMFAMFVLLTVQFRSYFQPLIILLIIPFGAIGAIAGHALLGMPISLFSLFGLIALTGVVVNDSIVLVDFINRKIDAGTSVKEAILQAGMRRFRPVVLTSITTVAGLTPMLFEKSLQAQILIPMATSMVFGLILATILVLFLVPGFYMVYATLTGRGKRVALEGVSSDPSIFSDDEETELDEMDDSSKNESDYSYRSSH
jgi:hydrophobic/amphiphilic exporter-1 (mainly G- bacteria), HAE1 family